MYSNEEISNKIASYQLDRTFHHKVDMGFGLDANILLTIFTRVKPSDLFIPTNPSVLIRFILISKVINIIFLYQLTRKHPIFNLLFMKKNCLLLLIVIFILIWKIFMEYPPPRPL